jgi:hypothetical protein
LVELLVELLNEVVLELLIGWVVAGVRMLEMVLRCCGYQALKVHFRS